MSHPPVTLTRTKKGTKPGRNSDVSPGILRLVNATRCPARLRLRAFIDLPTANPGTSDAERPVSVALPSVSITTGLDPLAPSFVWNNGCFGKGSLSRSEATWWRRETQHTRQQRAVAVPDSIAVIPGLPLFTAEPKQLLAVEDVTFLRRRARKIKRQSAKMATPPSSSATHTDSDSTQLPSHSTPTKAEVTRPSSTLLPPVPEAYLNPAMEVFTLTLEEAFFLHWALGVLDLYPVAFPTSTTAPPAASPLTTRRLWEFLHSPTPTDAAPVQPRLDFVARYAVYHYYRSRGWVVRSGLKFACDYVLYQHGPARQHSLYTVTVLPATDPRAAADPISWDQLIALSRLNAQARKVPILCYVTMSNSKGDETVDWRDITGTLARCRVSELRVSRWVPERTR
ncbi:tRNA splicing endonuclease subunit sen2 [Tieghemiomyces parasiticus]|uniref:tRNA-splicing endonuclease subunit Sen2 n=1 Tax=Tieghemiomyces parasiticus TaxID=78921 RepID=A0A9W7ZQB0_9FUNG|nr:tRNA splicing endonuclease subunit sen2 [Tieghemiomyces parasiticus]